MTTTTTTLLTRAECSEFLHGVFREFDDAVDALSATCGRLVPRPPALHLPTWRLAPATLLLMATDRGIWCVALGSEGTTVSVGNYECGAYVAKALNYQPRAIVRAARRIRAATEWHRARIAGLQRHSEHEQALHADACNEILAAAAAAAMGRQP